MVQEWTTADLQPLLAESRPEGHKFVDRLVDDFADGSNRFDQIAWNVEAERERFTIMRAYLAVGEVDKDGYTTPTIVAGVDQDVGADH